MVATTDHTGTVTQRYAYDPFGKRRFTNGSYDEFGTVVVNWSSAVNAGTPRGFTGHEGLDDVGLVNMNGRIFDPTLGVFLQADPLIQAPDELQNYNRYGYCHNNPLTCTDPSGFSMNWGPELQLAWKMAWHNQVFRTSLALVVAYWLGPTAANVTAGTGAAWTAAAGFASGAILTGTFQGGVRGAFSALAFYAVGSVIETEKWSVANNWQPVVLHGVVGCITGVAGGGKCGPSAMSAAFSKAATPLYSGDSSANLLISVAIGGTASVIGGGKFANGAVTAAYGYLYNCVAHGCSPLSSAVYGRDAQMALTAQFASEFPASMVFDVNITGPGERFNGGLRPDYANVSTKLAYDLTSSDPGQVEMHQAKLVLATAGTLYSPGDAGQLLGAPQRVVSGMLGSYQIINAGGGVMSWSLLDSKVENVMNYVRSTFDQFREAARRNYNRVITPFPTPSLIPNNGN